MDNSRLPQIRRPSVVVDASQITQDTYQNKNASQVKNHNYVPLTLNMWSQTHSQTNEFTNNMEIDHLPKDNLNSTILRDLQEQLNNVQTNLQSIREDLNAHNENFDKVMEVLKRLKQIETFNRSIIQCEQCHSWPNCSKLKTEPKMESVKQQDKIWKVQNGRHLQEINSPTSSGISTLSTHTSPEPERESIQYTIIAEGNSSEEDAPIQIELTTLENENWNTSEDSHGQLQICLEEIKADNNDIQMQNKDKEVKTLPKKRRPFEIEPSLKRKKLALKNNNDQQSRAEAEIDNRMVTFGPHNTVIPARIFDNINWEHGSRATRQLLMALFDRNVLATHSLSGKPSPAFVNFDRPTKGKLDAKITEDIIDVVSKNSKMSAKQVRIAITTKCADENKMMKMQINRQLNASANKENVTL